MREIYWVAARLWYKNRVHSWVMRRVDEAIILRQCICHEEAFDGIDARNLIHKGD